ncbi:hypothetical protein [Sulfitobacter sp. M13]
MPIYHNEDHRLHFPQAELSVGEIIAANVPVRGMHMGKTRTDIDGKVGYYCHASETAMTQGTWAAALSSVACAEAAQRHVAAGTDCAFALCRPPGHHATADQYGGDCLINNAAVAAKMFCTSGTHRVAILDIDFHDGNGCDVWSTALDDAIAKITAWGAEALVQDGLSAFSNWKVTISPMPVGGSGV